MTDADILSCVTAIDRRKTKSEAGSMKGKKQASSDASKSAEKTAKIIGTSPRKKELGPIEPNLYGGDRRFANFKGPSEPLKKPLGSSGPIGFIDKKSEIPTTPPNQKLLSVS